MVKQESTAIKIEGMVGALEAQLHYADADSLEQWALICHPHPLHGGTMHNKVVTTLVKAYVESGINALVFNYRGVGASAGVYGDMRGEVEDAKSALAYLFEHNPLQQVFLAGFSFGAYIAAQVAYDFDQINKQDTELQGLTLVAPSVLHSPFEQATPFSVPCLLIAAEADEVVPFDAVNDWGASLYPPVDIITMADTSHFFHGKLLALRQHVKASLV